MRHVALQIEHRRRQRPEEPPETAARLAVQTLRKHLLWYTRGRRGGVGFRRDAVRVATPAEVEALIDLHFPPDSPFELDPAFRPDDEAAEPAEAT